VTFDRNGNLLGTAPGGTSNCIFCGVVYKLAPKGNDKWTESIVHRFQYSKEYGAGPQAGLTSDGRGNLYGTTPGGQAGGFLFDLASNGNWNQWVLPDGGSWDNLFMDTTGDLFGTGDGVFEITPGSGGWSQNIIYMFDPHVGQDGTDGMGPEGAPISDSLGNLYAVTGAGGNYSNCSQGEGCGTVFELLPKSGGTWKESILHRFAQFKNDGQVPSPGLVMDKKGNIYGTTVNGGKFAKGLCWIGCGTVFRLSRNGQGKWTETILHNFTSASDGAFPNGPLVIDDSGNLYGTTSAGANAVCYQGCGVVFKIKLRSNGASSFTTLHEFDQQDGAYPPAGLTRGADGSLYGTTFWGGANLYGVVFQVTP
jgi:uncharacterized repeat protein (TIGR03803 family)